MIAFSLIAAAMLLNLWMERPRDVGAQVVLLARWTEHDFAAQVARMPRSRRIDGGLVAAVVEARGAAKLIASERGDAAALDRMDLDRVVLIVWGREGARAVYLDDIDTGVDETPKPNSRSAPNAPTTSTRRTTMKSSTTTKRTAAAVAALPDLAAAPAPTRAKKKPRKSGQRKFGTGEYGYQSKRSAAETVDQIRKLLRRFDCSHFAELCDADRGMNTISFRAQGRVIRFELPMPREEDLAGYERCFKTGVREIPKERVEHRLERLTRARYRALFLAIKARLVMIQSGISDFSSQFLPERVDEVTGRTIAELARDGAILPQLAAAPSNPPKLNGARHTEARPS